jgi:crotonobetainyl-CoA:carnitine CoA-transferase CaiB-like acyl-CoA transferase
VWDVNQTPQEVVDDPQARANAFVASGEEPGPPLTAVTSPAQFDGRLMTTVPRAPEHGEHTEQVLLEHGYSWDEISALKADGAII